MSTLADYLNLAAATPDEQAERIRKFATKIKVDVVTVRRYLAGSRRPSWAIMPRIVKETRGVVTADDFMGGAAKKNGRGSQPARLDAA